LRWETLDGRRGTQRRRRLRNHSSVIPAKAGIQVSEANAFAMKRWTGDGRRKGGKVAQSL